MLTRETRIDTGQFVVTCKATKPFTLDGVRVKAGELFKVRRRDLPLVAKFSEVVKK